MVTPGCSCIRSALSSALRAESRLRGAHIPGWKLGVLLGVAEPGEAAAEHLRSQSQACTHSHAPTGGELTALSGKGSLVFVVILGKS